MLKQGSHNFLEEIGVASIFSGHSRTQDKMDQIKMELNESYPFIHRLAIAVYQSERDMLQTFWFKEDKPSNITHYEAILSECASLKKLSSHSIERVVNDLAIFDKSSHEHSKKIKSAGFNSSFTMPLIIEGQLLGFLFANSRDKGAFHGEVVKQLKLISMVVSLLLHQDVSRIEILKSTVESMKLISSHRDPETGEHLQRMANYSLMIARELAPKYKFSDARTRYIYLYAPLHDVGKITVPDSILLKKGSLTKEEFAQMKVHSVSGYELVQKLINVYSLADIPYIDVLTSIVRSHHEKIDGTGYPDGLVDDEISIDAKIVAVADIFDALTSNRPYKNAWSNDDAFAELQLLSGTKLDPDCVEALLKNREKIIQIQQEYTDNVDY